MRTCTCCGSEQFAGMFCASCKAPLPPFQTAERVTLATPQPVQQPTH